MAIISNLLPNPSFETNLTGWSSDRATLTRKAGTTMAGRIGQWVLEAASLGTASISTVQHTPIPALGGVWVGFRVWVASETNHQMRPQLVVSAGGDSTVAGGYSTGNFYGGTFLELVTQLPANATAVAPGVRLYSGSTASITPGTRLWMDQGMLVSGPTQADVLAQLAGGYRDGDSLGWAWDGPAHGSASRGIDGIYTPEAELLRSGARVDWVDLVPGFEEAATSGTVVQVTADPTRAPYVTVRPGRDARGTLTMHFVRETGKGRPGDRAEAAYRSLSSGAPHTLRMLDAHAGLALLELVPCGVIRRDRQARSDGVWTVEFDFHRTVVPT